MLDFAEVQAAMLEDLSMSEQFLAVLTEEKDRLANNKVLDLADLETKKKYYLDQLEKRFGFYDQLATLENLPSEIVDLRNKIIGIWQQCQQQNVVNGKVIAFNLQTTQRIFNIIRGTQDQVSVYEANGNMSRSNSIRDIDEV